jgi:hypothetical protein
MSFSNPNITWDIVKANPDKKWNYFRLVHNPSIDFIRLCSVYKKTKKYYKRTDKNNSMWRITRCNYMYSRLYFIGMSYNPISTIKELLKYKGMLSACSGNYCSNDLNYHKYFQSVHYKRNMTERLHSAIHDELIMRACTPARMYQWNEGAAEDYPEEYAQECNIWKFR